jgi:small subunit ribosomal protein S2
VGRDVYLGVAHVPLVTLEELIQAGVHFGHRCSRWNPKMAPFIYGKRNQIHIINLKETVKGLLRATHFLERLVRSGGEVLIVGTKPQLRALVKTEAERCGMHYVAERWLGGTLTNHATIRSRLKRLEEIEMAERDPESGLTKKGLSAMAREKKKLLRNLEGIRRMHRLPQAMIIIDPRREESSLAESTKMGIPSVCVIDTDADPANVDIAIPANDDAYRSVQVILSKLADAVLRGREKLEVSRGGVTKLQQTAETATTGEPVGAGEPTG